MSRQEQILIVTNQLDVTADEVVRALAVRGQSVTRVNTEEMPLRVTTDARFTGDDWEGGLYLRDNGRQVDTGLVKSIWWRRPAESVFPDDLELWEREFARSEIRQGFLGLLDSLNCLWVSHPDAIERARACLLTFDEIVRQAGARVAFSCVVGWSVGADCVVDAVRVAEGRSPVR